VESGRRRDPFADWFGQLGEPLREDRWQPAIDVYETEKAIVVRVDLAGVRASDLRVTAEGDALRIEGVRRPRAEADVQRLHQLEIPCGPFERSVRITIPFERDQVVASLEEGFLRVTLPKRGPVRRTVQVDT
jgi:HSP20 family protein